MDRQFKLGHYRFLGAEGLDTRIYGEICVKKLLEGWCGMTC
jgi:hypothetical protein